MTAVTAVFDTVIRNGRVVDGTGAPAFSADIALRDGRIAEVGPGLAPGRVEHDAAGCLVTPGFVDVHTHYDGQAIWSERLDSSTRHGVTTVLAGNCGVGFAPCRPGDRDLLVNAMEGVEDIPEVVMTHGLPWDWETFPDYLDALERRPHDIDIGMYVPHSPIRVFAMGGRGARREPATPADLDAMTELVREAAAAGALGFATSRLEIHRRGDNEHIPSFQAPHAELIALARGLAGTGIVQIVTNLQHDTPDVRRDEVALMETISREAGIPVMFSLSQPTQEPQLLDRLLEFVDAANARPGVDIRPQFAPRPIGIHLGLDLSTNPFTGCPSFRALAGLSREQRVAQLRRPEVRAHLLAEQPTADTAPIALAARTFHQLYPILDRPDYEPPAAHSVAARADAIGVAPVALAYDLLLERVGHALLYLALSNYATNTLDFAHELFGRPDTVLGLGDGGAHYGMVCDYSYPTFVLTHWTRTRTGAHVSLERAVQMLTATPADAVGLGDRGRITPGRKADINVIDYAGLKLLSPQVVHDLPGGGRRLDQRARGYRRTLVAGETVMVDGESTAARPGRLVRGPR